MADDVVQRVFPLDGGMVDARPPHAIAPNECAKLQNWRVFRNQLRTCKGYAAETSAVIRGAITAIRGMFAGTRSDGTQDLLAAADGGLWKIVGDSKTLLSTLLQRTSASITEVSAALVTGNAYTEFIYDISASDLFWVTADDRETYMAEVSGTPANASALALSAAYGGTTAGAFSIWRKQTDAYTRATLFMDRWFFVNGTDPLREWDGTNFRDTGLASLGSIAIAAVVTAGGSLTASTTFYYKFVWRDDTDAYGNFDDSADWAGVSAATDGSNKTINLSWTLQAVRPWYTKLDIYRQEAASGTSYFLATVAMSANAYSDDGTVSRSITKTLPARNVEPGPGFEDIAVFHDRLVALSGDYLWISGLPPTDPHTLFAGRYEPEYWYYNRRIGYGEGLAGASLLNLRGNLYILTQHSIWRVVASSDDPDAWEIVLLVPNVGCESRYSVAQAGEWAYWLGRIRGRLTVIAFNGSRIVSIGEPMMGTIDEAKTASLSAAAGGCGHGFYWCSFEKSDSTFITMEYNADRGDGRGAWALRDWHVQHYAQGQSETYAAFSDGLVNKVENGYSAAGAAIDYEAQLAALDGQVPEWKKHWHSSQTEFEAVTGAPTLTAFYRADEGTWLPSATTGYNVSANQGTAVTDYRGVGTAADGRRIQRKYLLSGSTLDVVLRGIVVKGGIEQRDVD